MPFREDCLGVVINKEGTVIIDTREKARGSLYEKEKLIQEGKN